MNRKVWIDVISHVMAALKTLQVGLSADETPAVSVEARTANVNVTTSEATEKKAPGKRGRPPKSASKPAEAEEKSSISVAEIKKQAAAKAKAEEEDETEEEDAGDLEEIEEEGEAEAEEVDEDDDLAGIDDKPKAPPAITEASLRTKLVEFAQKNSKEEAYAILKKFGGTKVSDLKPTDYAKVYSVLDKGLQN